MKKNNSIKKFFTSLSFRTKLLVTIFAVNASILLAFVVIYLFSVTEQAQSYNHNITIQGVEYLGASLNELAMHMEGISETLVLDSTLLASATPSAGELSLEVQLQYYNYLQRLMNGHFYNNIPIYSTVYYENEPIYLGQNHRFSGMDRFGETGIMQEQLTTTDIYWTGLFELEELLPESNGSYIGGVRNLIDYDDFGYLGGAVSVYVSEADIRGLLESYSASTGSTIMLLDNDNNIISTTNQTDINKKFNEAYDVDIEELETLDELSLDDDKKYSISKYSVVANGWTVVALDPPVSIFTSEDIALEVIFILIIGLLVVIILIDIIVSKSLNNRVKRIFDRIATAEVGGDIDGEDGEFREELRQVLLVHKTLHDNNKTLSERILEEELAHKNATLSLLHAQIDSHFLYNSLDSINWMARKHKADDIVDMVQLLSKFYRLTLAKGREVITIKEELEHTQTYLRLQQIRYEDQLDFEIITQGDFTDKEIVKLTLQPLVENAIIHGIMEKDEPGGKITITANLQQNILTINILDDGVGIPQNVVASINNNEIITQNKERISNGSNFGIRNIKERLKIYYQDNASLTVKSPGSGTLIELKIGYSNTD